MALAVEVQEVVPIQTREAGVLRLRLACGLWKVLGTKQFLEEVVAVARPLSVSTRRHEGSHADEAFLKAWPYNIRDED
jgi:hypothetical protein